MFPKRSSTCPATFVIYACIRLSVFRPYARSVHQKQKTEKQNSIKTQQHECEMTKQNNVSSTLSNKDKDKGVNGISRNAASKTEMERRSKGRGRELFTCMKEHAIVRDICRVMIRTCDVPVVSIEQSRNGRAQLCAMVRGSNIGVAKSIRRWGQRSGTSRQMR